MEKPARTTVTLDLALDGLDRDTLISMEAAAYQEAETLLRSDPRRAALFSLTARFLCSAHLELAAQTRQPANSAAKPARSNSSSSSSSSSKKPPAADKPEAGLDLGKRTKHVRGSNGMCSVDHGDGKPCGYVFKRKPRAGSSAAVAQAAADATLPLIPAPAPRLVPTPATETPALGSPEESEDDLEPGEAS